MLDGAVIVVAELCRVNGTVTPNWPPKACDWLELYQSVAAEETSTVNWFPGVVTSDVGVN